MNENQEIQLENYTLGLLRQAETLEVVDQDSADAAGVLVAALKSKLKEWEAYWREPKEKARAAHVLLCDREGEVSKRVKPAIARLSEMASAWIYAEREKFRKAKEARERAEWEANRKAEEAESKVEAVSGFEGMATAIAEIPPPADLGPAPEAPRVEDAQFRDHYVFEVEDYDLVPRRFLKVDDEAVNNYIHETKDKASLKVPGLKFTNKPIMATRRSR